MKVIKTNTIGYCSGVRRTIDIALKTLEKENCYAIGEIVHNKEVVKELEKRGLKLIDNTVKDSTALIRTHGLGESKIREYESKNIKIIDGTCPLVKKTHKIIKKVNQDTFVLIIGSKNHSEVNALLDLYDEDNNKVKSMVIQSIKDIDLIKEYNNYIVVSQTTESKEKVDSICKELKKRFKNIVFYNTLCPQPQKRIDDIDLLISKTDAIFVVGGFKSANTNLIYSYLVNKNVKTYLIENKDQITKDMLVYNTVGLTSGSSTCDKVINEIEEVLKNGC